jgi:tripartite ATP-independent transporter DctM subunit
VETWLISLILIGGLLLLLVSGLEIAVSMGIIGSLGLWLFVKQPQQQFAYCAWEIMNSFVLTAMPLFIFMGAILGNTGIIAGLFKGAEKWIGGLPGGVAISVIGANAIFGAMSGSSIAAAATFSKIAFPEMEKLGYNPKLSIGSICVGGTLSVLIPPSILFIVYGAWEGASVARLFAAGLIPGIILTLLFMLTIMVLIWIDPNLAPKTSKYTMKERLYAVPPMLPFLMIIIVVLGVVFTGIMTPTESAALGAFLSLIIGAAYRKLTLSIIKKSMFDAVIITSMVAFVLLTARVLGLVFSYIGLTKALAAYMLALPVGKYIMLTAICILYLILGCFFDTISMMVLTFPFVSPIIRGLGFDPIWFGVIFVVLGEIGMITPPFGLNLFVVQGALVKYDLMVIGRASFPFIPGMLLLIVILIVFPQLALWLPNMLYTR